MGKRLIITGADFSENGIKTESKKYNVLIDYVGNTVSSSTKTVGENQCYINIDGTLVNGGVANGLRTDKCDVSGYTTFKYEGNTTSSKLLVAVAIILFYNASDTICGSVSVDGINQVVTRSTVIKKFTSDDELPVTLITGKIPNDAVYAIATCVAAEGVDFSLTVYKES